MRSTTISAALLAMCTFVPSGWTSAQSPRLGDLIQLGPDVEIARAVLETPVDQSQRDLILPVEFSFTLTARIAEAQTPPLDPLDEVRPRVLRDPDQPADRLPAIGADEDHTHPLLRLLRDTPYGFTGPSGVRPTEQQTSSHFIPVEDRWRLGLPDSDRYGKGHPIMDDYPGVKGAWWDPYNQNVLKGDYPIIGRHTFLNITGINLTLFEARQLPTPTTPFEATRNPGAAAFFGDPDSFTFINQTQLALDLFHGNTFFKPVDWRVKVDLIFNHNSLVADELGIVSPNVLDGTSRHRQDLALEEWFFEAKLADLSPYYDFMSVRAGSQLFISDFRGLIFADINRAVRLFGTRHSNRDQFNVLWFDQTEKNTDHHVRQVMDGKQKRKRLGERVKNGTGPSGKNRNRRRAAASCRRPQRGAEN